MQLLCFIVVFLHSETLSVMCPSLVNERWRHHSVLSCCYLVSSTATEASTLTYMIRIPLHVSWYLLWSYCWSGQTPRHAGSVCPLEWQSGPDCAEPPQEVCGPGYSAHASPWLGRAGDDTLREGAWIPWSADRLTYQQLGPQRLWTLSFLCCETLNNHRTCLYANTMFLVRVAANVNVPIWFTDITPKCRTFLCIQSSSSHSWRNPDLALCVCPAGSWGAGLLHICPPVGHADRWEDG